VIGERGRSAWRRIRSIGRKELRQLSRDPLTMGFVVGVPLVQLLLFGYAINQDIRGVPTAIVDHDSSHLSRWIVGQLEATQTYGVTRALATEEDARAALREGSIQAAIVVPGDFTRSYYRGRGAEISVLIDATDPLQARALRAAADGLARHLNDRLQVFLTGDSQGTLRAPSSAARLYATPELVHGEFVRMSVLHHYNPEVRTPIFVVPGLLGVILTTTMILMTSVAIVRERERGTFEFLIATPVRRAELMLGKILPYVGIGVLQVAIVVVSGLLLFRVPMEGSFVDLAIASLAFIAANLTLGLVISSVTTSQLQATQVSFFFFLPSVLLSGFMFPFEAMPRPVQWLGELLPLTHFVRMARAILLRGAPLAEQLTDLGALVLFTAIGLVAATRLFRKSLG